MAQIKDTEENVRKTVVDAHQTEIGKNSDNNDSKDAHLRS